MDEHASDIEARLRLLQTIALIGAAGALVFTIFTLVILVIIGMRSQAQVDKVREFAQQNHAALCAFQSDLKTRRNAGALFLVQHPAGLTDRFGNVIIPSQQLRSSVDAQTATLIAIAEHIRGCPTIGEK